MIELLEGSPTAFILIVTILGMLIGSFLNVVIYRLPIMLENRWQSDCKELLEIATENKQPASKFNLATPSSHCPGCNKVIRPWENIPIFSYLFLKGRCNQCHIKIPRQYPLVEFVTALLSAFAAWQLGFGWATLAALLLTWTLIVLTVIDLQRQLLPDNITLSLMWMGLLLSITDMFTDPVSSLLGAAFGYLSLWSIYHIFRLLTGKEGMGYGDFKLLAALGAWLGWQALPVVILLSSLIGALIGIGLIVTGRQQRGTAIPFGPFLAGAGWVAFYWGNEITQTYLQSSF